MIECSAHTLVLQCYTCYNVIMPVLGNLYVAVWMELQGVENAKAKDEGCADSLWGKVRKGRRNEEVRWKGIKTPFHRTSFVCCYIKPAMYSFMAGSARQAS